MGREFNPQRACSRIGLVNGWKCISEAVGAPEPSGVPEGVGRQLHEAG